MNDEIIEIDSDKKEEVVPVLEEENNYQKPKMRKGWNDLSKKTKIIIISSLVLVVLIIIIVILYFVFFKKDDVVENNKEKEEVIVVNDNYRYENGSLIFLDKSNRTIGSYECSDKTPDNCVVAKSNFDNDTFDRVKSVYENDEEIILNSIIYFDNYVFVKDNDEIKLYDILNKKVLLELKDIKIYDSGSNLVVIKDASNKYGLIKMNEDGFQTLIECSYDNLGIINPELNFLIAESGSAKYIVDTDNKKLSSNISVDVKSVSDKYFVGQNKNNYKLYSLKYEELLTDYDYIGFTQDLIVLVKDDKLYLRDNDLNKLNVEGIELEDNNYVKKYVYDSDNKLKETLESYEIKVKDNKITVTVHDNDYEININEGLASKNYAYLSYYDGKLYFYSDNNKNNLIGTYTCGNINDIKGKNDTLNNCHIYNTLDATSGIYNNQFVFISDSNDNSMIYLYDIINNKTLGSYNEIEVLNNSELNKDIQLIYTDSSYILAKSAIGSNKGNYGILEITSNKAQGKIEFKYISVAKQNDYYLLVNTDKVYSIYNHDFKKVSNEFSYIELYDNYYVGISDNKLNIYKYDNALGILSEGLDVTDNNFKVEIDDYFNITINDVTYKYDLEGHTYEE